MAKESQNIIRCTRIRAVARALIGGGGGGVYSYIRVMPDGFLLKSVVFKLISKEISRAYHEYMNTPPPPSHRCGWIYLLVVVGIHDWLVKVISSNAISLR